MIRFGPSGNSESFYSTGHNSTIQAPKWLNELGLNAYEYSFGRGINISDATATSIGLEAKKYDVEISVHSPYYINFANPDDEMVEKSYNYVTNSSMKVRCFNGNRVVFHPASLGKANRIDAVNLTKKRLNILTERIYKLSLDDMLFCPETMGKINQIGTLEEVVDFCKIDKIFVPTIDFGHLNARTFGGIKSEKDYDEIISYIISELGNERASKMHIHFSKIEYSKVGGEVRHLTLDDHTFGPEYPPLAKIIKKYNLSPVILSESAGTQTEDALTMKRIYLEV